MITAAAAALWNKSTISTEANGGITIKTNKNKYFSKFVQFKKVYRLEINYLF